MKKKTKRLIKELRRSNKARLYFLNRSENESSAWMDTALEFARQIAWMEFEKNHLEQDRKYPPEKV